MIDCENFFFKFRQNFLSETQLIFFSQTTITKLFMHQSEMSALPAGCYFIISGIFNKTYVNSSSGHDLKFKHLNFVTNYTLLSAL